ncbi:MAG TPA: sulfur carrier protein ThiS [Gammaproteobacteria bacterium]|nr:sulfur carrier protein ThiS [Gammaproteobacteria bacterium]
MIQVLFNNTPLQIEENITLSTILKQHDYPTNGIAVIRNQNLIPYSQYAQTVLHADDVIEIILPMQGG